jgi:hypothetical protein
MNSGCRSKIPLSEGIKPGMTVLGLFYEFIIIKWNIGFGLAFNLKNKKAHGAARYASGNRIKKLRECFKSG